MDLIKEESRTIIALRIQNLIDALAGDIGSPNDSRETLGGLKGMESWERTLMRYESDAKIREHIIAKYHEALKVFEATILNSEITLQAMERGAKG